jgi:glycosyltransferase involved in cell wall biosynthesis
VPLVTTLRGYDVHRSYGAMLGSGRLSWMRYALGRRRLMENGALFLAVSDALRTHAAALGFPESRLVTHYNGVNLDVFSPAPVAPLERIVLHIGRLVEKKGTALLIDAFAQVAEQFPDATLVIAGDGPLRGDLERQAAPLGQSVRFLGHLAPDRMAELMRRAWLLAAPSLTARDGDAEGLPNVVVEAAASGVPVVASAHAGIPEAVEHEVSGLIVPEGEVGPLAEALQILLASAERQRAYALGGRKLAESRFDARRQAERLEQLYDCVVAAA